MAYRHLVLSNVSTAIPAFTSVVEPELQATVGIDNRYRSFSMSSLDPVHGVILECSKSLPPFTPLLRQLHQTGVLNNWLRKYGHDKLTHTPNRLRAE